MTIEQLELWLPVVGYEGLYEISSYGRVKSVKKPGNYIEKILVPMQSEYLTVRLSKENKNKSFRLHRLVALVFLENPNKLPVVNHINGNKQDNRADNLEWCTESHNRQHALRLNGTDVFKGEGNGRAKLTSIQVLEMRELQSHNPNMKFAELGRRYSVAPEHVAAIIKRNKWRHV